MKLLLNAVKTHLQNNLSYIRESDIYISPHTDYIPDAVKLPCIGIKDGDVERDELFSGCLAERMLVKICVFIRLERSREASIIGDDSNKGLLDIEADIHALLDNNELGLDGMIHSFCRKSGESSLLLLENSAVQHKILEYEYQRERQREG
jgi:hypothetical protein